MKAWEMRRRYAGIHGVYRGEKWANIENMALTEHQKRWHHRRRADLRARGMCEDCGQNSVKPGLSRQSKPHRLCEECLQDRRDRWISSQELPLWRRVPPADRVH